MKAINVIDQLERLEDQLQAIKWSVRLPQPMIRISHRHAPSIVSRTAGLLRGRLPTGRIYQRRIRREWELRLKREVS
ncbi:MAG: hypothetical protein HY737_00510 [Candidatus Omnitrophica bacterium]|nr:hypothetical protein [Candidatus Omnitrophota bacterium]